MNYKLNHSQFQQTFNWLKLKHTLDCIPYLDFSNLNLNMLLDPFMTKDLMSCWSRVWIICKETSHKVFRFFRHCFPNRRVKFPFSFFNFVHNCLGIISVKRSTSRQEHISNHTTTPDVTFWAIAFRKDLRCDVIRSSNHFSQRLIFALLSFTIILYIYGFEILTCSKINNFKLIPSLLVTLKKDIFWL